MISFFLRVYNYISDFYHLSSKDIFLFSYPKSGNTRIRLAIAYYQHIIQNDKKEFDFNYLNSTQVEFGQGKIREYRKLSPFIDKNLFIKTHKIFDIKFFSKKNKIVYVARPSLETLISYYEYKQNRKHLYNLSFKKFLKTKYGAIYFLKHLKFGISLNSLIIIYSDLINNPLDSLIKIFKYSGIKFENESLKKAVYLTERKNANNFINSRDTKNYKFTQKKHRKIDDYFDKQNLEFAKPLINYLKYFKKNL